MYKNKMEWQCLYTVEFVNQFIFIAGFSDENSEWLTPAQRKRKIEQCEEDEDSDSQWEEDDDDDDDVEGLDHKGMDEDDDDEDMVDDYGADEGDEQDSDGEEVWN